MTEDADFKAEITHLKAELKQVVKERDIVQKQLTTRLLPLHISLLIVSQVLMATSMFAAYEWTEVDRLERLLRPLTENTEFNDLSQ